MTATSSTYTYKSGATETVTLSRGPQTPTGKALLRIGYSDGEACDCYVDTAWLRDRLDALDPRDSDTPRPLTPDDITDEMVRRAAYAYTESGGDQLGIPIRAALTAALTKPTRPEGAEELEAAMKDYDEQFDSYGFAGLADFLAPRLLDPTVKDVN